MTLRHLTALVATIAVFLGAIAYLGLGVLKVRTLDDMTTVTISAPKSNGLHAGSAVLFRGVPIGSVESVAYEGDAIRVRLSYESRYKLPTDSQVSIQNQSLIGESGVMVMPPAQGGSTMIADGDQLAASVIDVPASVPQLLGSAQTILDQVDPGLVNSLVDTVTQALAGTDQAVETLTPAAQMLAATFIYSQPALVQVIQDGTDILRDGTFIGPSLRPVKPEMIYAGNVLRSLIPAIKPFADYTQYGDIIRERWKSTLDRGAALAAKNAPAVGELLGTLVPAAQRAGSILGTIDLATLVDRASQMLPGDTVRLQVGPAN
ncbi:MAG: MCE family protein [Williamsia herbipolensis]|nr:MCE family protein [Williamsia herbipolensis]